MSLWELRQAIESAIPAWVSVPLLVLAVALVLYAGYVNRGPR